MFLQVPAEAQPPNGCSSGSAEGTCPDRTMAPCLPPPNPTCSSPGNDITIHPSRCCNLTYGMSLWFDVSLLPITNVSVVTSLIVFYKHLYSTDCVPVTVLRTLWALHHLLPSSSRTLLPVSLTFYLSSLWQSEQLCLKNLSHHSTSGHFWHSSISILVGTAHGDLYYLSPVLSASTLFTLPMEPMLQPHHTRNLLSQWPPAPALVFPSVRSFSTWDLPPSCKAQPGRKEFPGR